MIKFLHEFFNLKRKIEKERREAINYLRKYYENKIKEEIYFWLSNYFNTKYCFIHGYEDDDEDDFDENQTKELIAFKKFEPLNKEIDELNPDNFFNEQINVDEYVTEEIAHNVQKEQDEHGIIFDDMDKYNTIQLKDIIDENMQPNSDPSFVEFIYNSTDNQSIKDYIDQKKEEAKYG